MNDWTVEYHAEFAIEVDALSEDVQDKIAAMALVLEQFGPNLSRPRADTLKDSKHPIEGASVQGRQAGMASGVCL
jgi:hypothetical protein